MEFSFNLRDFFTNEISVIETSLLPRTFSCSVEKTRLCISAINEILNKMGEASAKAQKLQTPVTSGIKFSHSDQVIYIIVNFFENCNNGSVIGYLKMGWKNLFIFDMSGSYIKKRCFCCLDFYIHDSKQRQGFGKKLFDFMLRDNKITANLIPIDRPSEKLLMFLKKHYNLCTIIPQSNNFILYQQFFYDDNNETKENDTKSSLCGKNISHSVNEKSCEPSITIKKYIQEQWLKNAI